jgi:hypothetical protein
MSSEAEDLSPYLALLNRTGLDFKGAYATVYSIDRTAFARVLFNLHQGRSAWRGVAPHHTAGRFEHVAGLLVELGLVWFDQHKTRWELTDTALESLETE